MNSHLQTRLTTLESALTDLLTSISSYAPSISAATALLTADQDLQSSLKALSEHQRNTARIASLRQTISRQNNDITSHLTLLADVRRELLEIPTSLPNKDRREVSSGEVLSYAKKIARFTMPPNMWPSVAAVVKTETPEGEGEGNGQKQDEEGKGIESLEEIEKQWLDPWTGVQFTPWPGEEVIRSGGLAEIQAMVERGIDPATVGPSEGEETKKGIWEEMSGVEGGGNGQVQMRVERGEEKPRVFGGLDLYDPDEE